MVLQMLNFFISFYSGDELIEASVEAEKPKVDPEEKDDEDGNAFWVPRKIKLNDKQRLLNVMHLKMVLDYFLCGVV